MTQLKVKRILLSEDNNELVYAYLPKHYLEVKEIKDLPKQNKKFVKEVYYTVYSNISYEKLVNQLIAERYTIQDELAIQRKHQKGVNDAEFEEYDAYAEECKARAKEFIAERERVLNG